MASGIAYEVIGVPGNSKVVHLGTAANPSILFGDPNALGGLNDGLYGTTGPGVGVSINGTNVALFTSTGLASAGAVTSSSATAGIGYATGAGGTVTQATNKTTGVTLNTVTGAITMNGAALGAGAEATFTVTNSTVAAADAIIAHHASAGTSGAYDISVSAVTAGTFDLTATNLSAGSLSEAIVIRFAVIKAVSA